MITDELVREETAKVAEFYRSHVGAFHHGFESHEAFVRFSFNQHRELIERWGGLRFTGPALRVKKIDYSDISRAVNDLYTDKDAFRACFDWNAQPRSYPMPAANTRLYASRIYNPVELPESGTEQVNGELHVKIRKGQSVARAVLRGVREKYGADSPYFALFEKLFERLGQMWSASNHVGVTLSVAPSDMFMLGHLKCDRNSCYRAGSGTQRAKTNLMAAPNSVMLLVHRGEVATKPYEERGPIEEVAARGWGFMTPDGLFLSNRYGMDWSGLIPPIKLTVALLFDLRAVQVKSSGFSFGYYHLDHSGGSSDGHVFSGPKKAAAVWKEISGLRTEFRYAAVTQAYKDSLKAPVAEAKAA